MGDDDATAVPLETGRLPCGSLLDDLVEQVADGRGRVRTAHQDRCPACDRALRDLSGSWRPVQALRTQQVQAPAELFDSVLRRMRQFSHAEAVEILQDGRGRTDVSGWVVELLGGAAAQQVAGVLRVRGVTFDAARRGLTVSLVAGVGTPLPVIGRQVREMVIDRVASWSGVELAAVDVHVVDVGAAGTGPV